MSDPTQNNKETSSQRPAGLSRIRTSFIDSAGTLETPRPQPQSPLAKTASQVADAAHVGFSFLLVQMANFGRLSPWLNIFIPTHPDGREWDHHDYVRSFIDYFGYHPEFGPGYGEIVPTYMKDIGEERLAWTPPPGFVPGAPKIDTLKIRTELRDNTRIFHVDENTNKGAYEKIGGSASWRNNNPNNLPYAEVKDLAIGEENGSAIFVSATQSYAATMGWFQKKYGDLRLADALEKHGLRINDSATPNEKISAVLEASGIDTSKTINELTPQELAKLTREIANAEGYKTGQVKITGDLSEDVRRTIERNQGNAPLTSTFGNTLSVGGVADTSGERPATEPRAAGRGAPSPGVTPQPHQLQ